MIYRRVQRVVELMLVDQGLDPRQAESVDLPDIDDENKEIDWQRVENFLLTLSQDDLETLAVGEQEAMLAVAWQSVESEYAHRAIEQLYMSINL